MEHLRSRQNIARFALAAFVALLGVACATVPYSGRNQLMLLGFAQEASLGAQAFEQAIKDETPSRDGRRVVLDRVVARTIAKIPKRFQTLQWQHLLIQSDVVNAFAVPGGRIAVYEGLLPIAHSEAGLAAIVGHEVAHVTSRHGAERISGTLLLTGALSAAALSVQNKEYGDVIVGALGIGAQLGVAMPFSRKHELEADYVGMIYMARAGYDPHAAPLVWRRMVQEQGDLGPLSVLSTHPSSKKREARLTEALPAAMKHYRRAQNPLGDGERVDAPRVGGGK